MKLADRVLYHQVHPAKVYADTAGAIMALDLLWSRLLVPGLVMALIPPLLVSATLILDTDLDRYRRSAMGAYLRRFMPPWIQALRLFGAALAFYAAWHHQPALVIAGLALVAVCWANGVFRAAAVHLAAPRSRFPAGGRAPRRWMERWPQPARSPRGF